MPPSEFDWRFPLTSWNRKGGTPPFDYQSVAKFCPPEVQVVELPLAGITLPRGIIY